MAPASRPVPVVQAPSRQRPGKLLLGAPPLHRKPGCRCQAGPGGRQPPPGCCGCPRGSAARPRPPVRVSTMRPGAGRWATGADQPALKGPASIRLSKWVKQAVVPRAPAGLQQFPELPQLAGRLVQLSGSAMSSLTVHRHRYGLEWLRCQLGGHRQQPSERCSQLAAPLPSSPFGAGNPAG